MSIQVSLNGLSFCAFDTIGKKVEKAHKMSFKTTATPYLLLKQLKLLLRENDLLQQPYEQVSVVHRNPNYCLVPKALFDSDELPNYLKFNTKLPENINIAHEELANREIVCVYIPFDEVNKYMASCFDSFDFTHTSTAFLHAIFQQNESGSICYVHVSDRSMELAVLSKKKLLLYNQFEFKHSQDFLYYILFVYEQLGLNVEKAPLKLFGAIEEGDDNHTICNDYLGKVVVFVPKYDDYPLVYPNDPGIDLTLLDS